MPKDPRNEREAQPHLQAAADRKYLKYERHLVKPSYRDSDWREVVALLVGYAGAAACLLAIGVGVWLWIDVVIYYLTKGTP